MSAKKAGKGKPPTPPKKRTRFPRVEAALAGGPPVGATAEPTEAVTEPMADAAPPEVAAAMATTDSSQTQPAPEGPATDTVKAAEEAADATPPEPATEAPAPGATTGPAPTEGTAGVTPAEATAPGSTGADDVPTAPATKARKPRAARPRRGEGHPGKLSALDAAARVLGEAGQPMGCKEMIDTMAARGYWTSPGGKTPEATLYSAILREVNTRGEQARFVKAGRGQFGLRPPA
jgi:hypothetical protein